MPLKELIRRHPTHKKNAHYWSNLTKLVAGGSQADKELKAELLINPDKRPQIVIDKRLELAPYLSFMGGILTKLEAQLLAKEATYKSSGTEADSFWDEEFFPRGALGKFGRISFHQFLKDASMAALTQQIAIAIIDVPNVAAENRVQQQELGGDKPYVHLKPRESLWDWDMDTEGFLFAKFHDYYLTRKDWRSDFVPKHEFLIYQKLENGVFVERIVVSPKEPEKFQETYFDVEKVSEDEIVIEQALPPTEVFFSNENGGKIFRFPIVTLKLDPSLWLADQLYDPQVSLFNQSSAAEWALFSTNYAQLIFKNVDDEEVLNDRLNKAGDGYYWSLPPEVEPEWLERGGTGIDRAFDFVKTRHEEMLGIVQQVSYSAAMSYAGLNRSGVSKQEDRRNLDILLEVYAQAIKTFAKECLDVCSIARGNTATWEVDGLNKYDSDSLLQDLEQYTASEKVINSETFRNASQQKLAVTAMNDLGIDNSLKDTILAEIDGNNFYLDETQLEALSSAAAIGKLSSRGYLEVLLKANILPKDFDIDAELARQGTEVVNLANADDNLILS